MINLIKSTFYKEEQTKKQLKSFISRAKKLSFGEECLAFEKRFAEWQGRKHCILLNSGSSANLALIQSLLNLGRIKKGDVVGFSGITWSTNVMPLIQLGLQPVPIDVELNTLNISSSTLLQTLKKHKIKLVFVTNLLGFCDDIDEIKKICKKKNILLIEDNCESLGSKYKQIKLGNFGLASTFSYYVGHHISTIEGGSVLTDDDDLAAMVQIVRAHGWDRNLDFKKQESLRKKFEINSPFYSRYTFYDLGYNMRPTEICGFLGNVQMTYVDEITKKRQENFKYLAGKIYKNTNLFYPIKYNHMDFISNFAVPLVCKTLDIRDEFVKKCRNIIEIRPIVGGDISRQPFYLKYLPSKKSINNNSDIVHRQGLYFGNNPELTKNELETLVDVFSKL
jgi:CDP-4-dehydro-6-deoxyglucose reductase, E1